MDNDRILSPSAGPSGSSSLTPIPTFQVQSLINDTPTELVVQTFDDRILVIVTQNGKVGCLTQAQLAPFIPLPSPPTTSSSTLSHLPPPPPALSLMPLLGAPPSRALNDTYVSQIATLIWWALQEAGAERRGVVVGLSLSLGSKGTRMADEDDGGGLLDEDERERFKGVMELVSRWPGPGA